MVSSRTVGVQGVRTLSAGPASPAATLLLALAIAPVLYVVVASPSVERIVAALLGLLLVVLAVARPDRALLALIIFLPFQALVLAKLFAWGVPESIVRPLGGWKEALALGVVVSGGRAFMRSRRRLDGLDLIALAFIAIVALYALAPSVFAPGAPSAIDVRSLGFRQLAGFVVLLLAARHADLPAGFTARAMRAALGAALVVAAIGIYEFFFDPAWNNFVARTLEYSNYQFQVLEVIPVRPHDYRTYGYVGGEEFLRIGSVFLTALNCGFYLVIGFAIGLERAVREGPRGPLVVALLLIASAIMLTQTRSAIIAALVVAGLIFWPAAGRRRRWRTQLALALGVGLLLALPAAASTGLADRASTTASADDPSATDHLDALRDGLRAIERDPLGRGLGTSAGVGQRFVSEKTIVSENYYLQVGTETGVVSMLAFIALTVFLIRELRRAAVRSPDPAVAALWSAAAGLAVGAFFLHTWGDFAVSWTLWGLAGAVLAGARHDTELALRTDSDVESVPEPGDANDVDAARHTGGRVPVGA